MKRHRHEKKCLEDAVVLLTRSGFKKTKPRLALIQVLVEEHGPFTMEELHRRVRNTGCDLVTIYRCLTQFEKIGIARRVEFGDGIARYELREQDDHHHHIICRKCHSVEDLEACLIEPLDRSVKKKGFTEISHSLEFYGLCLKCA